MTHNSRLTTSPQESFGPPGRQHVANPRPDVLTPAAEQIGPPRARLIEEPLLLEGFPENDPQHSALPGVGHFLDARTPAVDECLRRGRVFLEDPVRFARPLAGSATIRFHE